MIIIQNSSYNFEAQHKKYALIPKRRDYIFSPTKFCPILETQVKSYHKPYDPKLVIISKEEDEKEMINV